MEDNKNIILYTDAGTRNNGKRGFQKTRLVVSNKFGDVLFEKEIGDYTNNEGEILAIIAALKNINPAAQKKIFSDSKIAINWALKGKQSKSAAKLAKKRGKELSKRLHFFIKTAHELLISSKSSIEWVPREINKAGIYIENRYGI